MKSFQDLSKEDRLMISEFNIQTKLTDGESNESSEGIIDNIFLNRLNDDAIIVA